jgi:hypothetical protein
LPCSHRVHPSWVWTTSCAAVGWRPPSPGSTPPCPRSVLHRAWFVSPSPRSAPPKELEGEGGAPCCLDPRWRRRWRSSSPRRQWCLREEGGAPPGATTSASL